MSYPLPRWAMLLLTVLEGCQWSCISSAPIVPVTPANSDQVSSCQSIASFHNGMVIGGMVVSGAGASLGTVGALESSSGVKTGLAIGAAIAAALALTDTAVAGYTASEFATSKCSSVVGDLPVTP